MSAKRIIPCLDIDAGRVVKGVKFIDIKDVGDPVEIARLYGEQGADEIVFLDITATYENRATMVEVLARAAREVSIPVTVGGGVRELADIERLLGAGAAKVGIGSAGVRDKTLFERAAAEFGRERLVAAIDAKRRPDGGFSVYINGGREDTGLDAVAWSKETVRLGAGEILLTSMDADGTKDGYDLALTKAVCDAVDVSVTASGGCGSLHDFYDVLTEAGAGAALAASLFHFRELTVREVKDYLRERGVTVL